MNPRTAAIWLIAEAALIALAALIHMRAVPVADDLAFAQIEIAMAILLAGSAIFPLVLRQRAAPVVLAVQVLAYIGVALEIYLSLMDIGPRAATDTALRLITLLVLSFGLVRTQRGTLKRD